VLQLVDGDDLVRFSEQAFDREPLNLYTFTLDIMAPIDLREPASAKTTRLIKLHIVNLAVNLDKSDIYNAANLE
jgi:hypothetical protein